MNNAITFFVGCVTFVVTMGAKIPIKRFTKYCSSFFDVDELQENMLRRRLNLVVILIALMIAVLCYSVLQNILELDHFKVCCALKATAIAVGLYYVFEQCIEKN